MPANYKLGRNCTVTIGGNALALARDISVDMGGEEVDVTTRGSGGIKQTVLALRDITLQISALYSPDNVPLVALLEAYKAGNAVALTLSDPDHDYTGKWCVTAYNAGLPLNGAATVDLTLKPSIDENTP